MNIFHIFTTYIAFNCMIYIVQTFAFPTNNRPLTLRKLSETLIKDRTAETGGLVNNYFRTKRQLNIIQSKIVDITHPKPIVDTLREEDKYGNTVEHKFGKTIVKAVENVSNVINSVFAFPIDTVKKVSRTATDALNNLGGKLVGLQK